MKTKVKKYAKGMLTDSSGNPVRSSSGEPVRTRSDDEIAADNKAGYRRYMPPTNSITLGKSATRPSEDLAPYEAPSTMSGDQLPKSASKEIMEEPATGPASGFNAEKYLEASGPKSGGSGRTSIVKPKTKKNAIVSKKQLEESGFQSLRDYLNDQQGKSRKMASGGKTSSASSRGDGIAQRGKTKGRIC
jgi:hypothetical protein